MKKVLAGESHHSLPEQFDPFAFRSPMSRAQLKHGLPSKVTWWEHSAGSPAKWVTRTSLEKAIDASVVVKRQSSGYLVYYDILERLTTQLPESNTGKSAPIWDAKPATNSIKARIALLPKLLKEIFSNPFRDFTLVKRGGEVFVVEKGVDLSGKDLSGTDLRRANLEKANLEGTLLIDTDLEEANLRGAKLKDAVLRNANLRRADMQGTILEGSDLRGADLWGANVDPATLSWATFENRPSSYGGTHG